MLKLQFDDKVETLDAKRLSLKPGDILVFRSSDETSKNVMEGINLVADMLRVHLGFNIFVMLLDKGLTIDTIISDPRMKAVFLGSKEKDLAGKEVNKEP